MINSLLALQVDLFLMRLKVLLPTDFSTTSHNAIVYAFSMFKGLDVEVDLLHVIHDDGEDPVQLKEITSTASHQFELLKDALYKKGIEVPQHISFNITHGTNISQIIDEYVFEHQNDLLILGATGEISSSKHLLSERTIELISLTKIPVLSIPKNSAFKKIKDIIYATDLSDIDFEARELIAFARVFDATVHFVHVFPEMLGTTRFKPEHITNDLVKKFNYPKISFDAIMNNEVEKALVDFIVLKQPEIVALFTHKRNIIEQLFYHSVTKELSIRIDTPIFTFKKVEKI